MFQPVFRPTDMRIPTGNPGGGSKLSWKERVVGAIFLLVIIIGALKACGS